MTYDEAIKKLQTARFEFTTLIPRLPPQMAVNSDKCRDLLDEVVAALADRKIEG